jgi:hypothetical protein
MARYEVQPFTADALDDAGRILSERHRHQRRSIFALDRKFETASTAREQVAALLTVPFGEDASGVVQCVGGEGLNLVASHRAASYASNGRTQDAA